MKKNIKNKNFFVFTVLIGILIESIFTIFLNRDLQISLLCDILFVLAAGFYFLIFANDSYLEIKNYELEIKKQEIELERKKLDVKVQEMNTRLLLSESHMKENNNEEEEK